MVQRWSDLGCPVGAPEAVPVAEDIKAKVGTGADARTKAGSGGGQVADAEGGVEDEGGWEE